MNRRELAGTYLVGFGRSGILLIVMYKLSLHIPVFIAQHGRLSLIGLVSLFLILCGGFMLKASVE